MTTMCEYDGCYSFSNSATTAPAYSSTLPNSTLNGMMTVFVQFLRTAFWFMSILRVAQNEERDT
eukprot:gene4727-6823_t